MKTKRIDLNADLGESFGAWHMGQDAEVLPWVTSANIACGFHAGDPLTMRRTVKLTLEHGVAIGAHPALPDLVGFGRRPMAITPAEAYAMVLYQTGALAAIAHAAGGSLQHVKPHGALYNMASEDADLADAIASAVRDLDASLLLVGLAGSALVDAGRRAGLTVAREAFADRRYLADGQLASRKEAGAVIEDIDEVIRQAVSIAAQGEARTADGEPISIEADTLCVHGDRANAGEFAQRLRAALKDAEVQVKCCGASGTAA